MVQLVGPLQFGHRFIDLGQFKQGLAQVQLRAKVVRVGLQRLAEVTHGIVPLALIEVTPTHAVESIGYGFNAIQFIFHVAQGLVFSNPKPKEVYGKAVFVLSNYLEHSALHQVLAGRLNVARPKSSR